jgi:Uma2 family endonuclease
VSAASAEAYPTVAPDWVCEVLSPSTEKLDRAQKLRVYGREGVGHAWLMDLRSHTLEIMRLVRREWAVVATHRGGGRVRAAPFEAIELELGAVWVSD